MKLVLLVTIIAFSNGEKLDRTYLPPNHQESAGSGVILHAPLSRPIVVLENNELQRQTHEEIQRPVVTNVVEVQRPVVTNVVELQRPIVTNVVTESAVHTGPADVVVETNPAVNDVVRIGNHGNIYVQNANPVEYKEVHYPGARYQVIEQRPERAQAALERNAAVLHHEYRSEGDAYAYAYDTENGIWAEENGVASDGVRAHGAFSYVGDDGVQYSMSYTADENGFQPHGDHLPVPPPIPEEILRSLEQNARDEAAGIYDDGSYDELKYGGDGVGHQHIGIIGVVPTHPSVPTIIETHPTVPTVIDQVASNEDSVVVTNPLVPKFRNPGYRYPTILVNQKTFTPVVNTLIQEVTPTVVSKAYLPPVKRKAPTDNRQTRVNKKSVVVNRNRKPEHKRTGNKS